MSLILIVDDEFSIVELLRTLLEDEGYQVNIAHNGQEGLECLSRVRPDLVLCDVMMPVLDGREMCRKMAANPAYIGIPIVFMSAVRSSLHGLDCHYEAFLSKPFDLDEVLNTVERLLQARTSSP